MDEEEPFHVFTNFEPVPKVFWSDLTGKPFDKCVMCERHLLEDGTQYLVEKAIKTYKGRDVKDTVFEYAICMDCRDQMHQKLSEESRIAINTYLNARIDPKQRLEDYEDKSIEDRISVCVVDKDEASEGGEYQIYAFCDGGDIILDVMPYMIRGEAMDKLLNLISSRTLDELNGFMKENFTGPPEFKEILDGPRVIL